ncbi:MAG: N-acetyltransferase family protein [Pseudomonadota bacterium]
MDQQPATTIDWTIRPATDGDGDALAELIAACFAEYPGCLFDRALEFPELDAIASFFEGRDGRLWVAQAGGYLVGSLGTWRNADGAIELTKVYVDRAHRGRGLAVDLLARAVERAVETAAPRLELWSDTRFTRAHRFYEKHGFLPTGETRFLADLSDSWEDRYVRPLNAGTA